MKPGDMVVVYHIDAPMYGIGLMRPECIGLYVQHINGSFEYECHKIFVDGMYKLYKASSWHIVPYAPEIEATNEKR